MCQLCADAVEKHYPHLSHHDRGELLMGATCFPFGSPEQVEAQLAELKRTTDGSLGAALAYADAETTRQMQELHDREKENDAPANQA